MDEKTAELFEETFGMIKGLATEIIFLTKKIKKLEKQIKEVKE